MENGLDIMQTSIITKCDEEPMKTTLLSEKHG